MILQEFDINSVINMDHSWMKVERLNLVYKKGVLEFLEFTDKIFLTIIESFIVIVLYVGTSKD